MNNEFKLAMQLTMIDALSGVSRLAEQRIRALGTAGKEVQRDFDIMTTHITRGLKAVAVASYGINKIKPGVAAAADMQEATLDVKMNLAESGQNAGDLAKQLATVRATAVDIQKQMPFGGQEVMGIENVLLKAGLQLNDVTAKGGAAWAAAALATISKEAPQAMGEGLVKIASPFNIKGSGYSDLAEFIAKVDQASVTSVPEIVEGMKYVAGNAAQLKTDWHEILTSMGVLAQSGLSGSIGGTSLNDFLSRLNGHSRETRRVMAGLNSYLRGQGASPLEFWDSKGSLKSMPAIIANLRQAMAPLNDKQKSFVMEKIFGEQGARAAFALMKQGAGSWEEISANIAKAESLQNKLNIRMEGFTANLKSLQSTSKTTAASIFDPWLEPLKDITKLLNEAVAKAGEFSEKHPGGTDVVNGVLAASLATVGGYGLYSIAKGGAAGMRVLRGLRGISGTGLGIAEGKAVQAVTGVTPVFVTNWPAGFGGGIETAATAAAGTAAKALPWAAIAGGGAAAAAAAGVPFSMWASSRARENGWGGWGGMTAGRQSLHERDVMGIGGRRSEPKNDIKIDVHFDETGRSWSRTSNMNTTTQIRTFGRGEFVFALSHEMRN